MKTTRQEYIELLSVNRSYLIQQLDQRHHHLKTVLEGIGDNSQSFDLVYELAVADLVTLTLILNPPSSFNEVEED